jgi:hypothetical protein
MTVTDAPDGAAVSTGAREFGLDLPVCTTRVFRLTRRVGRRGSRATCWGRPWRNRSLENRQAAR